MAVEMDGVTEAKAGIVLDEKDGPFLLFGGGFLRESG